MGLSIFSSIFLGIIEGLTEFAPVSSTAHILISGKMIGVTSSEFFTVFSVAIQSGAILGAVVYFWKTVWQNLSLIPKIIVGFLPTAVVGLLLHSIISKVFSNHLLIAYALIIGGIIFLFLKTNDSEVEVKDISYKEAFIVGCTQILAFIPGVSRSGATLIGGTALKIPRFQIVPFSFLLGIPTILGASFVELVSIPQIDKTGWMIITTGIVVSFLTALLTMKWFIEILTKKPLSYWGWYRIFIGILIIIFVKM
ncbi:undecaprenyl-diphosphate phosphatase [Candidatus Nomurabacteria bacterium]|nr:undecaprenyl-diphosphate phosphatase [Candidatus Nomurabacteria bacterium]